MALDWDLVLFSLFYSHLNSQVREREREREESIKAQGLENHPSSLQQSPFNSGFGFKKSVCSEAVSVSWVSPNNITSWILQPRIECDVDNESLYHPRQTCFFIFFNWFINFIDSWAAEKGRQDLVYTLYWTRLENSPQLDVSKASLKSDLKDGRTPSQSQMMMIVKQILKTTTWVEGRKQTTN